MEAPTGGSPGHLASSQRFSSQHVPSSPAALQKPPLSLAANLCKGPGVPFYLLSPSPPGCCGLPKALTRCGTRPVTQPTTLSASEGLGSGPCFSRPKGPNNLFHLDHSSESPDMGRSPPPVRHYPRRKPPLAPAPWNLRSWSHGALRRV